jgi:glycosyltransferase involved in cell wall biosynthesis
MNRPDILSRYLCEAGSDVMLVGSRSNARSQPAFFGFKDVWSEGRLTNVMLNGPTIAFGFNKLRVLSWLIFELQVLMQIAMFWRFRPDVIIASSPSVLTMATGVMLKTLLRARLVIEVRDIYPLTIIELGGFSRKNIAVRFLGAIERWAYLKADMIMSPLENLDEHVRSLVDKPPPFVWVPMGYDPALVTGDASTNAVPIFERIESLAAKGRFIVGYAGTIGLANDLERILKIAQDGSIPNLEVFMIGEGPLKNRYVAEFGHLTNVHFCDFVPKDDVPHILARFHLLLGTCHNASIYRFGVSPNKWIDYALSGRPFVTNLELPLQVISDGGNAFVARDSSDAAFQEEIRRIATLPPEELDWMGEKGRSFVLQHRSYRHLAEVFSGRLRTLLSQ